MKKPYATLRPATMLTGLINERESIQAQLAMKPETLRANLAAVERLIAIYQARATEQAVETQPKTLKAAAKLRADVTSSNGNGAQPVKKGTMTVPVLQALAKAPQPKEAMVKIMTGHGMNAKGLGAFVATKLVSRSEKGIYAITARGRERLAELTTP